MTGQPRDASFVFANRSIRDAIEGSNEPQKVLQELRQRALARGEEGMAAACLLQLLAYEQEAQDVIRILDAYATETGSILAAHVLSECHRKAGREALAREAWKLVRWEPPVDSDEDRPEALILSRLIGHPAPTVERTRTFLESSRANLLATNKPHLATATLKSLIELESREGRHERARGLCEELVREEPSAYAFQLLAIANEFLGRQAEGLSAYEAALDHAKHEGDAARVESLTKKIATLK